MSLPRRFSAPRILVGAIAALSVGLVADCGVNLGMMAAGFEDRHALGHGHGHRSGRNQGGAFRPPGTGKKYRLTKNRR